MPLLFGGLAVVVVVGAAVLLMVAVLARRRTPRSGVSARHRRVDRRPMWTVASVRERTDADRLRYYPTSQHGAAGSASFRDA